ncbi:MAG TPA: hypothetical protein VEK15_07460 [Vicinamibacteria bacterium]|nr:hypothetical protein [Vicinamibacteria bacterium]
MRTIRADVAADVLAAARQADPYFHISLLVLNAVAGPALDPPSRKAPAD